MGPFIQYSVVEWGRMLRQPHCANQQVFSHLLKRHPQMLHCAIIRAHTGKHMPLGALSNQSKKIMLRENPEMKILFKRI
jgi:hypothetical protein